MNLPKKIPYPATSFLSNAERKCNEIIDYLASRECPLYQEPELVRNPLTGEYQEPKRGMPFLNFTKEEYEVVDTGGSYMVYAKTEYTPYLTHL